MADKPILFSAPMVRAILAGRKTQTRRVLKPQPESVHDKIDAVFRWRVGDTLWVREAWAQIEGPPGTKHEGSALYRADACDSRGTRWPSVQPGDPSGEVKWKPSIHMPRWASRITLRVTAVRVQRLQDISEEDAEAEGVEPILVPPDGGSCPCKEGFEALWGSIHGPDAWDANPWVAAITFERVMP